MTTDHLGSPRIATNAAGGVISRKDFTAFGEEVVTAQRVSGTSGNGYDTPNIRQDYTGYQKDLESGLEFAQARYYNNRHGRFTSIDPLTASATIRDPQSLNRYSYALNSPYEFTDPLGLMAGGHCNYRRCVTVASADSAADLGGPASARPSIVLSGIQAKSLDSNGDMVPLTKADRKDLEKNLRKLIPGARVSRDGRISVPTNRQDSAASRLITGIAHSGQNVTIAVNRNNDNQTLTVDEFIKRKSGQFFIDMAKLIGRAKDTVVLWDPDSKEPSEERASVDRIEAKDTHPAIILAHELIHAYTFMRHEKGRWDAVGFLNPSINYSHYFTEGGIGYLDTSNYFEARTIGLIRVEGEITENDIRAQLGFRHRATYGARKDWQVAPTK